MPTARLITFALLAASAQAIQSPTAIPRRGSVTMVATAPVADAPDACDLDAPSRLCRYDPEAIDARFDEEPLEVARRIATIGLAAAKIKLADDGGATLRAELSNLGPVFCKVGQTLATRPDIIGLETSRNLGQLQDAMAPEPDAATAMATLQDALGATPIAEAFPEISATPVAAASLAEVYKARTADGCAVAVKIQRPGLERKV